MFKIVILILGMGSFLTTPLQEIADTVVANLYFSQLVRVFSFCRHMNSINITSDVWLTVHRNSVWIRKTN